VCGCVGVWEPPHTEGTHAPTPIRPHAHTPTHPHIGTHSGTSHCVSSVEPAQGRGLPLRLPHGYSCTYRQLSQIRNCSCSGCGACSSLPHTHAPPCKMRHAYTVRILHGGVPMDHGERSLAHLLLRPPADHANSATACPGFGQSISSRGVSRPPPASDSTARHGRRQAREPRVHSAVAPLQGTLSLLHTLLHTGLSCCTRRGCVPEQRAPGTPCAATGRLVTCGRWGRGRRHGCSLDGRPAGGLAAPPHLTCTERSPPCEMPRVRTVRILCVYRPISCLFVMYLCSPGRSVASATSTVLTTPTAPADTPSHSSWWREQRPRTSFDRHTRARNTHTHTTS
jgi:hypothetical protein